MTRRHGPPAGPARPARPLPPAVTVPVPGNDTLKRPSRGCGVVFAVAELLSCLVRWRRPLVFSGDLYLELVCESPAETAVAD